MKKLFFALGLCLIFLSRPASALTFNITYDGTVLTNSPNPAGITNAFGTAAQAFSDLFTNVATINIVVYWGSAGPFAGSTIGLGVSQFSIAGGITYSQITNALWTHRGSAADTNAVATIPATDPTGGGTWFVPRPEARILGFRPTNDATVDGSIGFATNFSYTFDPNNRTIAGKIDFIGVAQHELSEILGRCNDGLGSPGGGFVPYDLFRFTNNGVRSLNYNATTNAYFSLDNGATVLRYFYSNHLAGDIQDWQSGPVPDACDAFVSSGHINPLSTVDILSLDVLGYNGQSLQPPRVYETKTNANIYVRFVNSPGVTFTVLATTNLFLHETNWTVLGTATENPFGQFSFTDVMTNGFRFYSVKGP